MFVTIRIWIEKKKKKNTTKESAFIIIATVCNFQFKRDWSWCEPIFFFYFKFYVSFLSALYRYFEWSAKIQMSRSIVDLQNYVIAMKNWTSLITILLNVVKVCLGFLFLVYHKDCTYIIHSICLRNFLKFILYIGIAISLISA